MASSAHLMQKKIKSVTIGYRGARLEEPDELSKQDDILEAEV